MKIPLLGQTGEGDTNAVSYQKTQNWYPHTEPEGKSPLVLLPTPGLTSFAVTATGPVRGMIEYDDLLYVVSSNKLVEIDSTGTTTTRGTLTTSSGRVSMDHNGSDNGQQLIIVDGTNSYIWDSANSTFYRVDQLDSGTSTDGTANKLDITLAYPAKDFTTLGVQVGQRVFNTTAGTSALVTAVDSATVLSIDTNIFGTATDDYSIGDPDFPATATKVKFIDSYFLVNDPATTGRFYMSDSYDGTSWNGLNFATAERSPDALSSFEIAGRTIWFLGTHTAEVWYNANAGTGDIIFPFEPVQGGFSEWGCAAAGSVVEGFGSVFWLSNNDDGGKQVVMTQGLQTRIVSSLPVSAMINKLSTVSDAYGYTYQYNGHNFYVLTFPTGQLTLVYDLTTNMWHEWSSEDTTYHRSTHHVYVFNKHLVGDTNTGKIFELDWATYTDDGDTITRIRRSRPLHSGDKRVRHYGVWIDFEEGVGNTSVTDPQVVLRWRDDASGWSNEHWRSLGKIGETRTRCVWRGLGRSIDRVYEIKITDPVKAVIIDAFAKLEGDEDTLS